MYIGISGAGHPIQVGLRLVEEFRTRVKENIEADPLRAVAIAYEEELTRIKEQLGEGGDLEEFTALCPTLSALEPSMYRYLVIFAIFMIMIMTIAAGGVRAYPQHLPLKLR